MNKTAIIIPSRLGAQRLPNKPLKMIRNKEMIIHVYEAAVKSKSGEVIVATPDNEIAEVIKRIGGRVEVTDASHQTGTDRIFQVFNNALEQKPEIIINLQQENNITICICDHQARDLLACVDIAMILSNCKIVAKGTPSSLIKDINAQNAYFGNSFKIS